MIETLCAAVKQISFFSVSKPLKNGTKNENQHYLLQKWAGDKTPKGEPIARRRSPLLFGGDMFRFGRSYTKLFPTNSLEICNWKQKQITNAAKVILMGRYICLSLQLLLFFFTKKYRERKTESTLEVLEESFSIAIRVANFAITFESINCSPSISSWLLTVDRGA